MKINLCDYIYKSPTLVGIRNRIGKVNFCKIVFKSKILQAHCLNMAKKLYVGGLPYQTTNDELKAHFETVGAVTSATIIMDKMTGRSKGFGFVEMENEADADKAIADFDGKDFGGRNLTVNEARPMEPRQ